MPDYKMLFTLLEKIDLKKLKEFAESQIESYNKLIQHSPCKTDPNRQPCHKTDKGEHFCAPTLEASSLLKIAIDNLCNGNYKPAAAGINALAGQNDIMGKSPEEQKEFAFKAVKMAIENVVKCLPMPCRKHICRNGMTDEKHLYSVAREKAKTESQIIGLEISPDETIEITIAKRLVNPSRCFPMPDGDKITLESVICENISGEAQDIDRKNKKSTEPINNTSPIEVENIGIEVSSTEELTIRLEKLKQQLIEQSQDGELLDKQVHALIRQIRDEISRTVKQQRMRERVLKVFDTIFDKVVIEQTDPFNVLVNKLSNLFKDLNERQIRYVVDIMRPIISQHQNDIDSCFKSVLCWRVDLKKLVKEIDEIYRKLGCRDDELENRLDNLERELSDESILHVFTTLERFLQQRRNNNGH